MRQRKWLKDSATASSNMKTNAAFGFVLLLAMMTKLASGTDWSGDATNWSQWSRQTTTQVPTVRCLDEQRNANYICDCENVYQSMQLPNLTGVVFHVEIRDCQRLSIDASTFASVRGLRGLSFRRIERLVLLRDAFASNKLPLVIEFAQVNFELIDSHAFNGNIEQLSFEDGRIDVIRPFGFTAFHDTAVELRMTGVRVQRIEQQAFKKLVVNQLTLRNCSFEHELPTRAFYELELRKALNIEHNHFRNVNTHAFLFKVVAKLNLVGNRFESLAGEWLVAEVRDTLHIKDNYLGVCEQLAFRGLHPASSGSENAELRFINNTISDSNVRPLAFDDAYAVLIKELHYNTSWSCADLLDDNAQQKPVRPKSAFFRAHADNIYLPAGRQGQNQTFLPLSRLIELKCQSSSMLFGVAMISTIGLLVLAIVGLVIWRRRRDAKKQRRAKLEVIQPEPRTYKETQIIYQIENAGLLKTDL